MQHDTLDDRIVEAINAGSSSFTSISAKLNADIPLRDPEFIDGRLIDRRLQALRKKGRILWTGSASRSGWKPAQEPTA